MHWWRCRCSHGQNQKHNLEDLGVHRSHQLKAGNNFCFMHLCFWDCTMDFTLFWSILHQSISCLQKIVEPAIDSRARTLQTNEMENHCIHLYTTHTTACYRGPQGISTLTDSLCDSNTTHSSAKSPLLPSQLTNPHCTSCAVKPKMLQVVVPRDLSVSLSRDACEQQTCTIYYNLYNINMYNYDS